MANMESKEEFNIIHREYMKTLYHTRKSIIFSFLGGVCCFCGSTTDLEVDNVDRSKKTMSVSRMCSVSLEKMYVELANCQLLCKKCHINKSIEDFSRQKVYDKTISLTCAYCGTVFSRKLRQETYNKLKTKNRFCTKKCMGLHFGLTRTK